VTRTVVYDNQVTADIDPLPSGDTDSFSETLTLRVSYFSFLTDCNNPISIIWDPDFGVAGSLSPASLVQVSSFSLVILLLLALLF